jgi:hypothetical protein
MHASRYRLESHGNNLQERGSVRGALLRWSEGRGLTVDRDALRNPEVERRSKLEYPQHAAEITRPLPDFDEVYGAVRAYYEGLPWK